MRAWLFVLAVLATLQPIIQVASTEEFISSSNIVANNNEQQQQQNKQQQQYQEEEKEEEIINNNKKEKPDPATLVEVEKNLLSLFGFNKRPNVDRSKVVIPEAMKQLYAEIMGHEIDSVNMPKPGLHTKSANTVRSFTHEESKIDNRFLHHHRFRLYFNVTSIPKNEIMRAAELTLSRKAIDIPQNNQIKQRILVYDIVRPGLKGKSEPIFLLVDTKTVCINSTGTISIDVLPAVERWLKTPKSNYGLLIQIISGNSNNNYNNSHKKSSNKKINLPEHQHIRLRRSLNVDDGSTDGSSSSSRKKKIDDDDDSWSNNQPLLFTYTDDKRFKPRPIRDALQSNRSRRASQRKLHRRKEICQRRSLYVDFTDVGWSNWIVAPPGYDAYYCHGECTFPIADHLNSTNHAIVQTLVNSIDPKLAPRACCVPTQLTSISMLYLNDQNKVVLKNYMDMTVVGCGCR